MSSVFVSVGQTRPCWQGPRSRRIQCKSRFSEAATEIADAPRRRRVRRRERQNIKRPEPVDLEKELQETLLAEEARWSGPSETELSGESPHPVVGGLLESIVQRLISENLQKWTICIFEEEFPNCKAVVDYLEFRLLELDGKGVAEIAQFFLDFGYKEQTSFEIHTGTPIHCRVLTPPLHRGLPKIVLSYVKVDVDLSKACQDVIRKRAGDWFDMSVKYGATAAGVVGPPWPLPSKMEFDLIGEESHFAAWCIVHGYTPSCMALSVNEMRKNAYKFGANPDYVRLDLVAEKLSNGFPMNPRSEEPIWAHPRGFVRTCAPVAEVIPVNLSDGVEVRVPGSCIAFVERSILPEFEHLQNDDDFIGYEEEHYNHEVDDELLMCIHESVDAAVMVQSQIEAVHEMVLHKAESEGKVLTLDGSNEEDEELYRQYFRRVDNRQHSDWMQNPVFRW